MEIGMQNLTFLIKKKECEKKVLENINLTILEGEIVSFIGDEVSYLKDLFLLKKRPAKGEFILHGVKIKKTNHIHTYNGIDKIVGVFDQNIFLYKGSVKEYIESYMEMYEFHCLDLEKHIKDALKIVGLSVTFLNRDVQSLSFVEKKKVSFAGLMSVNPKIILLDQFDYGLSNREKEYFKKLLLKLKNTYHKTILLFNSSIPFLFSLVDKCYVIHKGKLKIEGDQTIFYKKDFYQYVDSPSIITFTNYVRECGYALNQYTDIKELLKELYRRIK